MSTIPKVSNYLPFFLKMWVKWHLWRYVLKADHQSDTFIKETHFIATPPSPYPMFKWVCKIRMMANRFAINKFVEHVDRDPWLMINGYSITSLKYPPEALRVWSLDKQYKRLIRTGDNLEEIYNNSTSSIDTYKRTVRLLIKMT